MTDISRFNDMIIDAMRAKGIDIIKLSEKTDIMPVYIKALVERSFNKLPAEPYVRGYLKTISDVLDIDFDSLWKKFLLENKTKKSGKFDIMPINRFEIRSINKNIVVIIIIVIVAFVFIIQYIPNFISKPSLEIISPKSNITQTTSNRFIIKGHIKNKEDKITINGSNIISNSNGFFSKEVYLESGNNTFFITAKRFLGKPITLDRVIMYTSQKSTTTEASTTNSTTNSTTTNKTNDKILLNKIKNKK